MKNKELKTIIENEFDCLINDLTCLIGEEWIAESVKEVANKAFALGVVSQQRELLIALLKYYENKPLTIGLEEPELLVDKFLAINCG